LALLCVVAALGAGGVVSVPVVRSLPKLDGQASPKGLNGPVQVTRDASDVTHISAGSALDTWRAMGFVHASQARKAPTVQNKTLAVDVWA
jgi:penicillin amidase